MKKILERMTGCVLLAMAFLCAYGFIIAVDAGINLASVMLPLLMAISSFALGLTFLPTPRFGK